MGLVESSQSRSFPWGPAKSRSAHQFSGDRNYDGKPRQAATLPGRTRVVESPLGTGARVHRLATPLNHRIVVDRQSVEHGQLNGSIKDSCDVDDKRNAVNKRRSDPLIGYFDKLTHNGTATANGIDESLSKWFLSRSDESLCTSEDIVLADDNFVRKPYFRTSVSFPFSSDNDDVDFVTCEEKQTQTSPPSTLDKASLSRSNTEYRSQQRSGRNKHRGRISNKLSTSVPANPRSNTCSNLYYDEPSPQSLAVLSNEEENLNNSLSRASLYINGDKNVAIPKSEKSQVFIKCNHSGNLEDVGMHRDVKVVQVSPNVWFESKVAEGKEKSQGLLRKQASDSNLAKVNQASVGDQINTHITQLPRVYGKGNAIESGTGYSAGFNQKDDSLVDNCNHMIVDDQVQIDELNSLPEDICNYVPKPVACNYLSDSPFDENPFISSCISGDKTLYSLPSALENADYLSAEQPDQSDLASSLDYKLHDELNLHVATRCTDGDTFPLLRLPRLEGQANLVDILASASFLDNVGTKKSFDERRLASLPNSFKSRKNTGAGVIFRGTKKSATNALDNEGGEVSAILPVNSDISSAVSDEGPLIHSCTCRDISFGDGSISSSCECIDSANENTRNISVNDSQETLRKMHSIGKDCGFTCHEQCQDVVSLDCKTVLPDLTADDLDTSDNEAELPLCLTPTKSADDTDDEVEAEEKHEEEIQEKDLGYCELEENEQISTLRRTVCRIQSQMVASSEIEEWVEKYSSANQGLQIAKEKDGSYRGCLRIYLNLSRPINIVAGTRPPSIYDILQEDRTMEKTLTSFYMPRDAVKAIHITSKTTTREVIVALLKKFKVVDNPQKFALYEKTYDIVQTMKAKFHRLGDTECPLVLAIAWGAQSLTNKRLVLQENDTADIQWDAFSLPELYNFLRILDKEETEYKNQIRDKYNLLRKRINEHLCYEKS